MVEKKMSLNDKLDEILKNQKKILRNEEKILGEEREIEALEKEEIEKEELNIRNEEEALKELLKLEKEMKKGFFNPLNKITKRDIFKSFVGAFFVIMGHFAFYKGADIAIGLSFMRATVLYVVAFFIIIVMLYYTGFRQIKKHIVLKFLPLRAIIIYFVSVLTILFVNLLFNKVHFPIEFMELYKLVGASIILAVIGAGTADLIGGHAE